MLTMSQATIETAAPAASYVPPEQTTAAEWFALGERVAYDPRRAEILAPSAPTGSRDAIHVFRRIAGEAGADEGAVWLSFLPGWPDGSFGWSKVDQALDGATTAPRLFVEYVGHGDSDKPADYSYGTMERADLVEAHWKAIGARSTFIVAFDYSSIVTLELLSRQQDRRDRGEAIDTEIKGVLLINGGLFVDAHSHPWFTTPILKSPVGGLVTSMAQHSTFAFGELMKPLWSKEFNVSDQELRELKHAIGRRNGVVALSRSAGFVDEHRRRAERWDLGRLFRAARGEVAFHIVGAEQDPFEGRQAVFARERLGAEGLDVRILPGGHLTTSEHPDLLARIIEEVVGPPGRVESPTHG